MRQLGRPLILPRFELAEPDSVSGACDILRRNENARVIAGGTGLLVGMKQSIAGADVIVSLHKIPDLNEMSFPDGSTLTIGPMMTVAEVADSPLIKANFPLLARAANKVGTVQIRNRATIGGNACMAGQAGDILGPLIAYGAAAQITSASSERIRLLETLFNNNAQTRLRHDEILTAIILRRPSPGTVGSYVKYTIGSAIQPASVSVIALLSMDNATCCSTKILLRSLSHTTIACPAAETFLVGKRIAPEVAKIAGLLAADKCEPTCHAPAGFPRELVQVLVRRCLMEAVSGIAD